MNTWFQFLIRLPLEEANWKFKQISPIPRPILAYWVGYLPTTKEARHILSVTKLTGWQTPFVGKQRILIPQKAHPQVTHDITVMYQLVQQWDSTIVLFHLQMETNDDFALKISDFLAHCLIQCNAQDKIYLLDNKYQDFWRGITSLEIHRLNQVNQVWLVKH